MKFSKTDLLARKRSYIVMAAVLFGLYTIMCAVIYPLCITTSGDVLYDSTVVPELLDYLYGVLELVAISAGYALLIFCVFGYTFKKSLGGIFIFFGATLYKYFLNMLADWAMNGSVPLEWAWDVVDSLYYAVLEAVPLLIVLLIICSFARRRREESGDYLPMKDGEYPFANLIDLKNYYLRAAFVCAVVVFASKISGRLINDVQSVILSGLPTQGITWAIMALAYLLEAISGVFCYAVIVLIISRILGSVLKKRDKTASDEA